ncbi:hypothetical protein [Aurantimonas sp. A3-2-R12]|uniref:hypothetical protein n=1 Tax=Aurantimonas sp. A3-2-R12 TaxID=3114362 RepID=UPI002E19ADAA|nr:hypothetical protein [Aurantimonas sp. A3-2-R12]
MGIVNIGAMVRPATGKPASVRRHAGGLAVAEQQACGAIEIVEICLGSSRSVSIGPLQADQPILNRNRQISLLPRRKIIPAGQGADNQHLGRGALAVRYSDPQLAADPPRNHGHPDPFSCSLMLGEIADP